MQRRRRLRRPDRGAGPAGRQHVRGSVDLTDPAVTFDAQLLPMSTRHHLHPHRLPRSHVVTAQTVTGGCHRDDRHAAGSVTTPITRVTLEVAIARRSRTGRGRQPLGSTGSAGGHGARPADTSRWPTCCR